MTLAKEWDAVQSLLFEAENKVDELEKAYLHASNRVENLTALVAEQKLRLEVHMKEKADLRAEVERLKDEAEEECREWLDTQAENARLREALEKINSGGFDKHAAALIARAALSPEMDWHMENGEVKEGE
jgi:DNA repair exonuclease SbcCD ATPase subunit